MSVGFKEWALICRALEEGSQSLLIRKGGIAEGREGFRFRHDAFYLFPTFFHEQLSKTTFPEGTPLPEPREGEVVIQGYARVEWTLFSDDWERVSRLAPFHFLKESVVRERFEYDERKGVHVAGLRVYRLQEPWVLPFLPRYGGCRSWVELPEIPPGNAAFPALTDGEHAARMAAIRAVLESTPSPASGSGH